MDDLLRLQIDFLKSYNGNDSFEDYIKVNGVSSKNRLSVYHGGIDGSFQKALAALYPLTWKLVGEDCAKGAAYAFVEKYAVLQKKGTLLDWGAEFADFLEDFSYTRSLPYLPDFVRWEWLKHLSYGAEDKTFLTAKDFMNMTPDRYEKLVLKFHPSAYLFSSPHPLDQVISVVEDKLDTVTLEKRGVYGLVIRPLGSVKTHWLSEAGFSFLSLIYQGDSLMGALEKMNAENFQFHDLLSFSLKNGLFSEYAFTS